MDDREPWQMLPHEFAATDCAISVLRASILAPRPGLFTANLPPPLATDPLTTSPRLCTSCADGDGRCDHCGCLCRWIAGVPFALYVRSRHRGH
jgi:hypothetical protein